VSEADVDPSADLPGRTSLVGDDGRLLLVFSLAEGTRENRLWADAAWRPPSAPVDETKRAVLHAFAGYAFSTSDELLADALSAAGAGELRHAHAMSHLLLELPGVAVDPRIKVEPLTSAQLVRHAESLGQISFVAYPEGHPDHVHDSTDIVDELLAIARGELLGPYLELSRVALADGDIVGACLVVDREGVPPDGGAWIIDVFRDPASQIPGIGTALITSVLAAAQTDGTAGVSLAVSHSNDRAHRLYQRLGFAHTSQSWTLALPA
jgi:ribosomal protein S18 acetylase RimI-like enzyme